MTKLELIKLLIEKIRPQLQSHNGDLEYVDFKEDVVYVKLLGACSGCARKQETLKNGIQNVILKHVPDVKSVELAE